MNGFRRHDASSLLFYLMIINGSHPNQRQKSLAKIPKSKSSFSGTIRPLDLKSLERTGSEKARYVLLLSDNCSKDFLFTNRTKGRENISTFLMFGC